LGRRIAANVPHREALARELFGKVVADLAVAAALTHKYVQLN
jgi:hypothetical protein